MISYHLINKIKAIISRNKTIIANLGYLSVIRIVALLIPLVTIPYLLKVLGRETYGLIVFAQAIVSYFLILVNFGFNLSATKEVSINRKNKKKLSEIVSSVLTIKGLFFLISFAILWLVLNFIPKADGYKTLFYLTMHICLFDWLFPIWYFQGLEKMKYITLGNLLTQLIFLFMIFLFVKSKNDYLKVPLIQGFGATTSGAIALWVVFTKHKIKFKWQLISTLLIYFKQSLPLFLGSIAGKILMVSNKAILGFFVNMESVAMYDIADKIKLVFQTFLELTVQALYPNVSKDKNYSLIRKSTKFLFLSGLIIYFSVGTIMSFVIPRYWNEYIDAINVFWILGTLIFLQSTSYLIGVGALIVNGLQKAYSTNLYVTFVVYLLCVFISYLINAINLFTISACLMVAVIVHFIRTIYLCKKYNLGKWIY